MRGTRPGRGSSPTDEARAAPPRTRPWHVRFRGNLCAALPKVACNSVDRTFLITQKRWNCNDTISIHKRLTGKLHATLLGNHDDAPYTIRSRPGQVEKHANTKPPPGSTGTTPAAPPPGRHHTTTSRKSTHNNTKGSGLNKPPQNPGFDTPAKGHCTRYVALHPLRGDTPVTWRCTRYVALHPNRRGAMPTDRVQCLQIGCTTPVTSSHADLPERTSTDPTGLAGPGGAVQTAGWARRRQGLTGLRDDEPSGRLAAQTTSGPPSARLTSLARHIARARGARGIKPGRVARAA